MVWFIEFSFVEYDPMTFPFLPVTVVLVFPSGIHVFWLIVTFPGLDFGLAS